MQKLNIPTQARFSELELNQFNSLKFAVYFLDKDWNYLFVNDYVQAMLGSDAESLVGKNMWTQFAELANDPAYIRMKTDTEKGAPVNFITTSPITGQRLNIVGYPLQDCYFFYTSQLPRKEDLMNELRETLEKHNSVTSG